MTGLSFRVLLVFSLAMLRLVLSLSAFPRINDKNSWRFVVYSFQIHLKIVLVLI